MLFWIRNASPVSHVRVALIYAFMVTGIVTSAITAQDKVRSDQRLPPGVLLYGSTPDIPASYEAFRNTSYGQLINSPELEEFRVQLINKFEEEVGDEIKKLEDELGMPISDVVALLAGDASFAVLRPIGQPLGVVAMLEYGDHDDLLNKLIEVAETEIEKQSSLVKSTEVYAGTEISVFVIPTEHPDFQTVDISYFRKDGQFVIASSLSLIESVLDRWDGKNEQCFANEEIYAAILKQCATTDGSTPDMITFFNPIGLTIAGLNLVPQAKPFVSLVPLYLPTLGLNRLKGSGSVMEVDSEEFNVVSKTMVYVERPASGILKMFELRPTLAGPAAWVPAEATQYFALDWNLTGAYEAVEAVYDGFLGPGAFDRQITDLTRQANQDNLHIKRDIIDVIGGKLEFYALQKIVDNELAVQFGVASSVTDDEKAWKLLNTIMKSAPEVEERELRGQKVYAIPTDSAVEISITISDGQLFAASGMEDLENLLAGKTAGPALKDSAEYLRAKAHLPEMVSMLSYQSPAAQLKSIYEKLRSGDLDGTFEGGFDFSVLPAFEKIEKYLTPSFGYVVPVEKGAYSVQFGLKPKD